VGLLRLRGEQIESGWLRAGVVPWMIAVLQLDGDGKEEIVLAEEEGVPDPSVEIWDVSGADPVRRLELRILGAKSVEFVEAPQAWPQDDRQEYVPPWLWTIPRRDPVGNGGPEWPDFAGFWPPDP
jgi:hypothetical protein